MNINKRVKERIQNILNVFETGSAIPQYDILKIVNDGKNGTKQISYGKQQVTEQGKLKQLIELYIKNKGIYSEIFQKYIILDKIGKIPLYDDKYFCDTLSMASEDSIMWDTQDEFFDKYYWNPALKWAEKHWFVLPLSMLIIYDSYIHSGCIPMILRKRFMEYPPVLGGSEIKWCEQYINVRHQWLKYHKNKILNKTVYRTSALMDLIIHENWELNKPPIYIQGVLVYE